MSIMPQLLYSVIISNFFTPIWFESLSNYWSWINFNLMQTSHTCFKLLIFSCTWICHLILWCSNCFLPKKIYPVYIHLQKDLEHQHWLNNKEFISKEVKAEYTIDNLTKMFIKKKASIILISILQLAFVIISYS